MLVPLGLLALGALLIVLGGRRLFRGQVRAMSHEEVEASLGRTTFTKPGTVARASTYRVWGKTWGRQAEVEVSLRDLRKDPRAMAVVQVLAGILLVLGAVVFLILR